MTPRERAKQISTEIGAWPEGSVTDRIETAINEALAAGDEPTDEQIAIEAGKSRILGIAISHYLDAREHGVPTDDRICAAVKALEALIPPGNLAALKEALLGGTSDGDEKASA